MPGVQTYTLIEEKITTSAANAITFQNIPAIYEDLIFEFVGTQASGGTSNFPIMLNGEYATNYSFTSMSGNGSAASSTRASSQYTMNVGFTSSNNIVSNQIHIMSYSNPNVFKTVLSQSSDSAANVGAFVGLWRKTDIVTSVGTFFATNAVAGSVLRLYGVVA